jgi:hypothetical protein
LGDWRDFTAKDFLVLRNYSPDGIEVEEEPSEREVLLWLNDDTNTILPGAPAVSPDLWATL